MCWIERNGLFKILMGVIRYWPMCLVITTCNNMTSHQRYGVSNHRQIDSLLYSLWPSDVIWRQGSSSTLAQVMACCLTAPSHYLNQCWLRISEVFGIHMMAISQKMKILKKFIAEMSLKFTNLRLRSPPPPWANQLTAWSDKGYRKHRRPALLVLCGNPPVADMDFS